MKTYIKLLIVFLTMFSASSGYAQLYSPGATIVATGGGVGTVGINDNTPQFPLEIIGGGSSINSHNFDRCIRVLGVNGGGITRAGSVIWDGSNVGSVTRSFGIGGPGNVGGAGGSLGSYYFFMQPIADNPSGANTATLVGKVFGNDIPGDPRMGSFQHYMDLFVANGANDGRVGINTLTPERSLHIENGSALIRTPLTGNNGLLFKSTTNNNAANWGDWGIQYCDFTGSSGQRGLNIWKPSGALYGAVGNNILFVADGNNVGIGTNNPIAKLHVSGDAIINGTSKDYWMNNGGSPLNNSVLVIDMISASSPAGVLLKGGSNSSNVSFSSRNTLNKDIVGVCIQGTPINNTAGSEQMDLLFRMQSAGAVIVEKMRFTGTGNLGIGTSAPSEQLHTTAGVRFAGLTSSAQNSFVVRDGNGKLYYRDMTGYVGSSCTTNNTVPRYSTASSNYVCSQITDDGTSVGINQTTGFGYTNPQLQGTTAPPASGTARLGVAGVTLALAYFATSDERMKTRIQPLEGALSKVKQLEGKTYQWNTGKFPDAGMDDMQQIGFIAQDLGKIIPEAVVQKEDGMYAVNYNMIIPVLTEAIKEQQAVIEDIQKTNNELKQLVQDICDYGCDKTDLGILNRRDELAGAYLDQNIPNPASGETSISYFIPENAKQGAARIIITDLTGKIIDSVSVSGSGKNSVYISTKMYAKGIYNYSLVINGNVIDTKKMIAE